MLLTELLHFVDPVGVVAVVAVDVGEVVVVVKFGDGGSDLTWVVVGLFQHHGVAVTIEHLVAIGLPGAVELVGESHVGGTTVTTAQLDLDDTIGTTGTPLSRGGILQNLDALDVLGVDVQQCRELLFVIHVLEVDGLCILRELEDVVVHDDQRLSVTINSRGTAQAHGSTGTEVTRVGHNVETCDLTLQGLVDRLEGHTFHLVHVERL